MPSHSDEPFATGPVRVVTTSWDDGDSADLTVAKMLRACRMRGTFYVPLTSDVSATPLSNSDLESISRDGFEVGAHAFSHQTLPSLDVEALRCEVRMCKRALEQITGKQVNMFCYPNGRYNATTIAELKRAGYKGARTTRILSCTSEFDPFEMPVSFQAYPLSHKAYLKNLLRMPQSHRWSVYVNERHHCSDWVTLGKRLFDRVYECGGVWHMYGHSWEMQSFGLWKQLAEVLDYVHGYSNVEYMNNSELLMLQQPQLKLQIAPQPSSHALF